MLRYLIGILLFLIAVLAGFLFLSKKNTSEISANNLPNVPEARVLPVAVNLPFVSKNLNKDIENQKPLFNPPSEIKAVYMTSWSAGSEKKINYLLNLIKETELNAIVIDIKDFSGYVSYDIKNFDVEKYGAKQFRIPKINSLIKRFHDEGIYVIARITVFQDPVLAIAHPDWAVHSGIKLITNNQQLVTSTLWLDHKGLAWMDPASKDVWDYNITIAKDAIDRGFDELNFDYIRFPADGSLYDMKFPVWDEKTSKNEVIKNFFKYLREQLPNAKISADLFGQATINNDDLGIGQIIEDAYVYFDYISPMIYSSHYAKMFLGYKNPANYPYEVVKYSMESALNRLTIYNLQTMDYKLRTKLRPWLQDFDLGANYDAEKVKKQIQAVYDSASSTPELINGWMLWNPSNIYAREALQVNGQ